MSDIRSLEEAVKTLPDNLPLRMQLAAELEKAARPEDALVQLDEVLKRKADDGAALIASARCLYEIGKYGEALERYDKAVAGNVALADAALRERIAKAHADPRARIRLVAGDNEGEPAAALTDVEKPEITFADVGGLDDLKEKIRLRILYPLKRPDLYKAFGKKIGAGCFSTDRRAAARRSWRGPRRARPGSTSWPSASKRSSTCGWGSRRSGCTSCFAPRGRRRRRFSFSTRWMRSVVGGRACVMRAIARW
jgi:tetratricopeptide (TPR) repeat protein